MSGTAITTAEINTAMNAAIAAQESGDYSTALTKVRSVKMMLVAKPDSEFEREKLIWDREAIDVLYAELKQLAAAQSGSTRSKIQQIPVRRQTSYLDDDNE
jgi:hypothetical protein